MKSILDDSNNISNVRLNVTGSDPVKILGKDDVELAVGITDEFDEGLRKEHQRKS